MLPNILRTQNGEDQYNTVMHNYASTLHESYRTKVALIFSHYIIFYIFVLHSWVLERNKVLHGKNSFDEISNNLTIDTDLKIIALNYQNNYNM